MGACLAVDEAAARSRAIEKQNWRDFTSDRRVVKLLLLGTGTGGEGGSPPPVFTFFKFLFGGWLFPAKLFSICKEYQIFVWQP